MLDTVTAVISEANGMEQQVQSDVAQTEAAIRSWWARQQRGRAISALVPDLLLRSQGRPGAWFPGCVVRLRHHDRLKLVGDLGGRREPAEDLCRNGIRVSQQRK